MCGRYSLTELNRILRRLGIQDPEFVFNPRYNIAPSQMAPVIVRDATDKVQMMKWGLVPSWAKDPSIGHKLINSRAETIGEKPSFRKAFQSRRCLIPADGFYEWQVVPGSKSKIPTRIILKDENPFVIAGLWEKWKRPDGTTLNSFSIITTKANHLLAPIHDRMPVVLQEKDVESWLNPLTPPDQLSSLLVSYPEELMEFFEVSSRVNSPSNDTPEIIQRIVAS